MTPWALYSYSKTSTKTPSCDANIFSRILLKPEDFLKTEESKLKLFTHLEKFLKELDKHQNNVLYELLTAVIYLKMENQNGAEGLIKKTLFRDPSSAFFNHCVLSKNIWIKNQESISKSIAQMLSFVKSNLKNKLLAEMLIHYFSFYENEFINKELKDLFEQDFDLAAVEKELKGVKEGKSFFPFWYFLIFSETSEKEKFDLAQKYFDPFLIRNHFENVAWVFESYFPAQEEMRKFIFDGSKKLANDKSAFKQDLFSKVLGQDVVKRELEKSLPELSRPIFTLRRKIYSEMLASKEACAYAFYQLMNLGDEQKQYLEQLSSCQD